MLALVREHGVQPGAHGRSRHALRPRASYHQGMRLALPLARPIAALLATSCPAARGDADASRCPVRRRASRSPRRAASSRMRASSCTARAGAALGAARRRDRRRSLQQGLSVLRLETTLVDGRRRRRSAAAAGSAARAVRAGEDVTLVLRFRVPDATPAGSYEGRLVFARDGRPFATVPRAAARVRRAAARARRPERAPDALPAEAAGLRRRGRAADARRRRDGEHRHHRSSLLAFLSDYRISPGNWEYGTPYPDGYQDRGTYWNGLAATRMAAEGAFPFTTMRLPIGTQHTPVSRTGQSPRQPGDLGGVPDRRTCCPFWQAHGWLEPRARVGLGRARARLRPPVRRAAGLRGARGGRPVPDDRRARADASPRAASTIPWGAGTRSYTVQAHGDDNEFLWDDQGCDDVDIWAVLSRRFYGSFATPVEQKAPHRRRSASCAAAIAHGPRAGRLDLELHLRGADARSRARRATRRPSRPPTRACSASGTRSRALTARSTPTA